MDESESAFDVDFSLSFQEESRVVVLNHAQPLLNGFWYAAMVLDSSEPCRDVAGRPIAFEVEFLFHRLPEQRIFLELLGPP